MSNRSFRTNRHAICQHLEWQLTKKPSRVRGMGADLPSTSALARCHKRSHSSAAEQQVVARKILNMHDIQPVRHRTTCTPSTETGTRNVSCSEQAIRLVANHAPEVLLVLATTLLTFIFGSSLPDARTIVAVVPLVLLRESWPRGLRKWQVGLE